MVLAVVLVDVILLLLLLLLLLFCLLFLLLLLLLLLLLVTVVVTVAVLVVVAMVKRVAAGSNKNKIQENNVFFSIEKTAKMNPKSQQITSSLPAVCWKFRAVIFAEFVKNSRQK